MKKLLCMFFVLLLCFSFPFSAMACEPSEDDPVNIITIDPATEADDLIQPYATLSFSFNLTPGNYKTSSEVYYVSNSDAVLIITSCTWDNASEALGIGWYNIETGLIHYVRYTGGAAIGNISTSGVPDGEYKIVVLNLGDRDVTGAIRYRVSE